MVIVAMMRLGAPARADSDDAPAATTQKPQLRAPSVNAARAIGLDEIEGPTIFEGIKALNPIDAARDTLRDTYGIYFHGVYLGDPYGDLDGGVRRGATYSGRLDVELDIDGKKAFGLAGTTVHANMFQIHGLDLSSHYVGNILEINDIAALPTTRLYELWVEQKLGDKLSVRLGQQGSDIEFLTSNYAANFINATFGWPGLPSVDLSDGGPAYPLATPAIRFKLDPTSDLSILAAAFDGVPAGPCPDEPQTCDKYGLNFRVQDPPQVLIETQLRHGQNEAGTLPGTVKLGTFANFGRFQGERLPNDGIPLAIPGLAAAGLDRAPDVGVYGIVDQQVYRVPGDDPEKGIGVFTRVIYAPPDRNLVDLYVDGGVSALGLMPSRPDDLFGVAAAFAKISGSVIASAVAAEAASGVPGPVPSFEAVVEVTYQAQVVPGLALQPTFQYIAHPGGNIPDPYGDGRQATPSAKVFGVTTTVRF